jgi:HTH-type transcriptional regulator / antitoxin HigA
MENIRPIRTDEDLAWAIGEITRYFDAPPTHGTPEADRFDVLSDLIEAYENRNHPVEALEPIAFLKSFMELSGRTQVDLAEVLGSRSRASEILNRKRALTVEMIHKLVTGWHIPASCLAVPYELVA